MPKNVPISYYLALVQILSSEKHELHFLDKLRLIFRDILNIEHLYSESVVGSIYLEHKKLIEIEEERKRKEKLRGESNAIKDKIHKIKLELERLKTINDMLQQKLVDETSRSFQTNTQEIIAILNTTDPKQREVMIIEKSERVGKKLADDALTNFELLSMISKTKRKAKENETALNKLNLKLNELEIAFNTKEYLSQIVLEDAYLKKSVAAIDKYKKESTGEDYHYLWLIDIFKKQESYRNKFDIDEQAKQILSPMSLCRILSNWFDSVDGLGKRTPEGEVSDEAVGYFVTCCQKSIKEISLQTPRYSEQIAKLRSDFQLPYIFAEAYELLNNIIAIKANAIKSFGFNQPSPSIKDTSIDSIQITNSKMVAIKLENSGETEALHEATYSYLPAIADGLAALPETKTATLAILLGYLKDILKQISLQQSMSLKSEDLSKLNGYIKSFENAIELCKAHATILRDIILVIDNSPESHHTQNTLAPLKLPDTKASKVSPPKLKLPLNSARRKSHSYIASPSRPSSDAPVEDNTTSQQKPTITIDKAPPQSELVKEDSLLPKRKHSKEKHHKGHRGSLILKHTFFKPAADSKLAASAKNPIATLTEPIRPITNNTK